MDSYYGYLGHLHVTNINESLDKNKNKIDNIQASENLHQWFSKVLHEHESQEKRKSWRIRLRKIMTRAALVVLILLASSIVVTVSVEAYRVKLLNFFMEMNEKYTSFEIKDKPRDVTKIPDDWDQYYPSYVPTGFTLAELESFGGIEILHFKNRAGETIKLTQAPIGSNFQIDTENSKTTEVEINGFKGVIIEKENQNGLFWHNNEATFYILSSIDSEELIKIAMSLEKK